MTTSPRPLGFIRKQDRTQAQHDAHARAMSSFRRFQISGGTTPTGPVKVVLTDSLKEPDVIADIGYQFTGFRQLTGSCVGVSAGDAICTLSAIQRLLSAAPTRAFVPWWPFPYGRTRSNEGDRGQGEGAIDSVMAATLIKEGVFSCTEQGLPAFDRSDGLAISSSLEMQWSDGASSTVTKWQPTGALHPLGSAGVISDTTGMRDAILNGYPILDGCDNYIGHGTLQGSGADACVVGQYDASGGHSTCYVGYWDHPNLGPLFRYWNQWAGDTYPTDPSCDLRCSTWVKEAIVARLFQTGGSGGETVALSHLSYFPAQPSVLDWFA